MLKEMRDKGLHHGKTVLPLHRQTRGEEVQVRSPENGGRIPTVPIDEAGDRVRVDKLLLPAHVRRPDSLHPLFRRVDNLPLAQHPVDLKRNTLRR